MKPFSPYLLFKCLLVSFVLISASCTKKPTPAPAPDPKPEAAKLTGLTLTLDGPKSKLDAVASHQVAGGIPSQASGTGITLSASSVYNGTLALEETLGSTKTNATTSYTNTYQITGVDASISPAGDAPTLTTRAAGTGTLKVTATKGSVSYSVSFPLTVSN